MSLAPPPIADRPGSDRLPLVPGGLCEVAVVGAHCDDLAIGAGGTLLQLARTVPGLRVRALVLTGGGTPRESEERDALAAFLPGADLGVEVLDLPDTRLPQVWAEAKRAVSEFARGCDPDLVLGPQRGDAHQDHRVTAELLPNAFRDHLHLGYEILKWENDLPRPGVLVPVPDETAREKVALLAEHYPSQAAHPWFDAEAFLGLMRVRGAQCHHRYAEGFVSDKIVVDLTSQRTQES